MTKKDEQALLVFERKIFRRIYGPKYENGEWKSWTNRELEEMRKGENIIKWIKGQMISWLGHLKRMEEDMEGTRRDETRRRGRPRERMERGSRNRSSSAGSEKLLLSAVFFLVVAQSSSEVPEGLMNNPVF